MEIHKFKGQARIMPLIENEIKAAKAESRAARHILLYGPPGVGKTTLAKAIATDLGATLVEILAGKEWTAARVNNTLLRLDTKGYTKEGRNTGTGARYVIFIDEVHSLPTFEVWYPVMLERCVKHEGKVSWIPEVTVIAATTELGDIPAPFRDRFMPYTLRLEQYTEQELTGIILAEYPKIGAKNAENIAKRSRNTARYALAYAQAVYTSGTLAYFDAMEIDVEGFTYEDRQIIDALENSPRPMSLNSLAAVTGIPAKDITGIYEPFLKRHGKMMVTPQGRTSMIAGRGPVR